MSASDFLNVTWRAVPRLSGLDTKMLVKDPETCKASIIADGKWGSENGPVVIVADIPLIIANHIISRHNDSFAVKSS